MKYRAKSLAPSAKAVEDYRTPGREAFSGTQLLRQVLECASPLALFPKGRVAAKRTRRRKESSAQPFACIRVHSVQSLNPEDSNRELA
jgi:hypothetical protein